MKYCRISQKCLECYLLMLITGVSFLNEKWTFYDVRSEDQILDLVQLLRISQVHRTSNVSLQQTIPFDGIRAVLGRCYHYRVFVVVFISAQKEPSVSRQCDILYMSYSLVLSSLSSVSLFHETVSSKVSVSCRKKKYFNFFILKYISKLGILSVSKEF